MEKNKKPQNLQDIFNDDPLGLLNSKSSASTPKNEDERLIDSFQEIVDFVKKKKRAPQAGGAEHHLYARLKGFRESSEKIELLKQYDKAGLLNVKEKQLKTINDIFEDDSLGLLSDDSEDLFDFKHLAPRDKDREEADFVAKRKVCKDFSSYEPLFIACQKELKEEKRKLVTFHENQIQEGAFFVLNGILVYVKSLIKITTDKFGKRDGRTKLIFENGTESNMLFRSLGKGLFQNGKGVTFTNNTLNLNLNSIIDADKETGFIYILKSKSDKQEIKELQDLFKIGFSKIKVEERIKNAPIEPTYLMAEVSIVATFKCFNLNPQKLEQLLHNFFGKACLNLDVYDKIGNRHTPREWFIAPLHIIEQAVHLIISGAIVNFSYDSTKVEIVKK